MAIKNRDSKQKMKRVLSSRRVQNNELATAPWADAVANLAGRSAPVVPEWKSQLPAHISARDFDIIRLRSLATWI